jgi:putative DNA primase/helicase
MMAREVAAALGDVRREGHNFRCRCPVHKGRNLTLADGRNALLVKCWGGCDASDVLAELRRLQLTGEICRTGEGAFERPDDCRDRERRIGIARRIWKGAKDARGTPVERYLAGRGITHSLCRLPCAGRALCGGRTTPPGRRWSHGSRGSTAS